MLRTHRINPFDLALRHIAVTSIKGYQRYISPHKGFSCAHRVLYGGESCSGYIKRAIAQKGLLEALKASRQRFNACKQASLILKSQQEEAESEQKNRQNSASSDNRCDVCLNVTECSLDGCDGCVDLPNLDCSPPHCDVPNCGDCGSGLDCSGCDCASGAIASIIASFPSYKRL
jgi:putative component of membrane protein insertase Oxa1/YidC/SpoIIIJ protein YidD